ncbi:hypothetical protein [Arthrobacter sp. R4-81]
MVPAVALQSCEAGAGGIRNRFHEHLASEFLGPLNSVGNACHEHVKHSVIGQAASVIEDSTDRARTPPPNSARDHS